MQSVATILISEMNSDIMHLNYTFSAFTDYNFRQKTKIDLKIEFFLKKHFWQKKSKKRSNNLLNRAE